MGGKRPDGTRNKRELCLLKREEGGRSRAKCISLVNQNSLSQEISLGSNGSKGGESSTTKVSKKRYRLARSSSRSLSRQVKTGKARILTRCNTAALGGSGTKKRAGSGGKTESAAWRGGYSVVGISRGKGATRRDARVRVLLRVSLNCR